MRLYLPSWVEGNGCVTNAAAAAAAAGGGGGGTSAAATADTDMDTAAAAAMLVLLTRVPLPCFFSPFIATSEQTDGCVKPTCSAFV